MKPRSMQEMRALATRPKLPAPDEPVTIRAEITLPRSEWATAVRKVEMAALCHRIGLSKVGIESMVLAQVVANGQEVEQ
jgi:hypothetical protein